MNWVLDANILDEGYPPTGVRCPCPELGLTPGGRIFPTPCIYPQPRVDLSPQRRRPAASRVMGVMLAKPAPVALRQRSPTFRPPADSFGLVSAPVCPVPIPATLLQSGGNVVRISIS